jgi:hypothetical protein
MTKITGKDFSRALSRSIATLEIDKRLKAATRLAGFIIPKNTASDLSVRYTVFVQVVRNVNQKPAKKK